MLHPVGNLPPSVYWRRRVFVLVPALVLVALTLYVVFNLNGGGHGQSRADGTPSGPPQSTAAATFTPVPSATSNASPTEADSSSGPPAACKPGQLGISSASDAKAYSSTAKPVLAIVVVNVGPQACVTDLADKQIQLLVFAGSARVWGSHDCEVQPGVSNQTLPVGQTIRREIQWSGLSSQPSCAGVRTRAPAGTYTLYAYLGSQKGKPATFVLNG